MLRRVALVLALVGVLVSGYLTLAHLRGVSVLCSGQGCETVQQSVYAQVGPIPTAAFGLAYYAAMTILILWEWFVQRNQKLLVLSVTLAWIAAMVSLVLTGIEAFVLHAYCAWCLVSAALCFLLAPCSVMIRKNDEVVRSPALAAHDMDRKFALYLLTMAAIVAVRGETFIKPPKVYARRYAPLPALFSSESHSLGSAHAPHTIVEYSDFQCPSCRIQYTVLRRFMQTDQKKIRWVYCHFPLRRHGFAVVAAVAAEAAGAQGKFFEMADLLYQNQPQFQRKDLERYAREIGLNLTRFREDMRKRTIKNRVKSDVFRARRLLINSVPTVYVDGRLALRRLSSRDLVAISHTPAPPSGAGAKATGKVMMPNPPRSPSTVGKASAPRPIAGPAR